MLSLSEIVLLTYVLTFFGRNYTFSLVWVKKILLLLKLNKQFKNRLDYLKKSNIMVFLTKYQRWE